LAAQSFEGVHVATNSMVRVQDGSQLREARMISETRLLMRDHVRVTQLVADIQHQMGSGDITALKSAERALYERQLNLVRQDFEDQQLQNKKLTAEVEFLQKDNERLETKVRGLEIERENAQRSKYETEVVSEWCQSRKGQFETLTKDLKSSQMMLFLLEKEIRGVLQEEV
jgi:hypothetical protein